MRFTCSFKYGHMEKLENLANKPLDIMVYLDFVKNIQIAKKYYKT